MALVEQQAPPLQQQQYLTLPPSSAAWLQGNVTNAVRRASDCVPDGALLLSMFGPEHMPLRRLALRRVRSQSCLMTRTVSLCWGVAADPASSEATCVSAPVMPLSGFRSVWYHAITWTKWEVLALAFRAGRGGGGEGDGVATAMFVDVDVALLVNPFLPFLPPSPVRRTTRLTDPTNLTSSAQLDDDSVGGTQGARGGIRGVLRRLQSTHDVLYQCEGSPRKPWRPASAAGASCGDMNTGQLVVMSHAAAEAVLARRPSVSALNARQDAAALPLEQQTAQAALLSGGWSTAALPTSYTSECWFPTPWTQRARASPPPPPSAVWHGRSGGELGFPLRSDWCALVSFHANCIYGGLGAKETRVSQLLRLTVDCGDQHARRKRLFRSFAVIAGVGRVGVARA